MSNVRAIFVADLHLQAKAPLARSTEPDWFEAVARPLAEISGLALRYKAPVLYAGDIFDRWNAAPEVINFALAHLPPGYAVPGQHDLPNHNYDEIKRSAYWTLVEAGKLVNLPPNHPFEIYEWGGLTVYGYPWGYEQIPLDGGDGDGLHVAIAHKFVYTKDTGYPGAPTDGQISACRQNLAGYDVAVFGDNHKGFTYRVKGGSLVFNCGGMMRRKIDERDYKPSIGLLHSDGTVTRHYLDTTQDKFVESTEAEELVEKLLDMTEFVAELRGLGTDDALDFGTAIRRFLDSNRVSGRTRDLVLEASDA